MGKRLICRNETRSTVVADKIQKADNYFTRLVGLLPKKGLNEGEGLWIDPCKDIHSIGMRFVFDAVFLDKELRVVHLIEKMKPLRVSPIIKTAKSVLELRGGTIAETQIQVGDQLSFQPSE